MIRAIRAIVELDDFSFDAYQMPNGEKRVSIESAMNLIGHTPDRINFFLTNKELKSYGFSGKSVRVNDLVETISLKDLSLIAVTESINGNPVAANISARLINIGVSNCFGSSGECVSHSDLLPENYAFVPATTFKKIEKDWQIRLLSQLGGQTEVSTPVGRIDLLTEHHIIEIKKADDWKAALGQVQAYSQFYPNRTKRICLFGLVRNRADIVYVCSLLDIEVDFLS